MVPPPASLVDRPRLRSLVNATEGGGVCIVSAAPGYGGRTLLRQVAARTRDQVAWARPTTSSSLWQATAEALRATGRRRGPASARREAQSALADAPPLWLMVELTSSAASEHDLRELAESLPPQVRMAVAAHREVLGGPVMAGRAIVIDERQLAFRPDEAVDLLPEVDVEVVEALLELSEGWAPAMLSAASAGVAGEPDVVGWLRTRGVDRLFGGWIDGIPDTHREFLLSTSVLETLDAGACNALRGSDDAAEVLGALMRAHAYVQESVEQSGAPRSWRRHPLLTLYLRRIEERRSGLTEQHSRAADWYREQGDVARTMRHLIAAGRADDAGHYLREHESSMFIAGHGATTLTWYDQLPGEAHGSTSVRLLRMGWAHALTGDVDEAQTFLERLRALGPGPGDDPDAELVLQGEIGVLASYVAGFHGDARAMVSGAEVAVAAFQGTAERNSEQLAYVMLVKGLQWLGRHDRAAQVLDLLERQTFPTDMIRESALASVRARRLLNEGRVHEAFRVADRSVRWVRSRGTEPGQGRQTTADVELAAARLELGDLDGSAALLAAIRDGFRRNHRYGDLVVAMATGARLSHVLGDAGAALRHLDEARGLLTLHAPGSSMNEIIDVVEARIRIDTGNLVRAERLIRELPTGQERTLLSGRLALARGRDPRRALAALDPPTPRLAAEQHLLLASARRSRGSRVAEAHLLRAAGIAVTHGQALLLVGSPPEILLLAEDTARRHGDDALASLVAAARREPATLRATGSGLASGDLQLLAYLPSRDSVAAIARHLGVSENTVKTRLQRLYRKLGAHSRDEAIAVARARGVL